MRTRRAQKVCLLIAVLFTAGCSAGPDLKESTLTGGIYDITIGQLEPKDLQVRVGDEVRWVNARGEAVKIVFVKSVKDRVSCENGFVTGKFSREARAIDTTTIETNKFASLCFSTRGVYHYTARMEAPAPGGEINRSGSV